MVEQESNSKKTSKKIFKEHLNDLRANLIRAHDYKVFMTETINALEILGNEVFKEESEEEQNTDTWSIKEVTDGLKRHGLIVESEVEHAEALRSPEESSSADA